jgi:membrane protein
MSVEERDPRAPSLVDRLKAAYRKLNDLSRGRIGVLRSAIDRFTEARGAEASAAMAYYTLFSLFPLLLALVAGGSIFLERQQVFGRAVDLVTEAFPVSQSLIENNLQQVMRVRGAVGIAGLIGALWSATGVFTVLTRNINRAWSGAEPRGFFRQRLVALGMVGVLAGLLLLSLLSGTALNIVSRLEIPLGYDTSIYQTPLWTILATGVPWLFTFFLFLALYRWVPNVDVRASAAFWAALVVAAAWELASNAFAWYVGSGLARYTLVYGSLGTVVALMFWIYLSSWLIIFGAHLSAAVAHYAEAGE